MFALADSWPFFLLAALFAVLATLLCTTRGNTIRDIVSTPHFNPETFKLEIAKFKLSTGLPVVALYVVAGLVPFAPFAYARWTSAKDTSESIVTGYLSVPGAADPAAVLKRFCLQPEQTNLNRNGYFNAPILHITEPHNINVVDISDQAGYAPITLEVRPDQRYVVLSANPEAPPIRITVVGNTIRLNEPVPLMPKHAEVTPASAVPNAPSRTSAPSDPRLRDVGSPP